MNKILSRLLDIFGPVLLFFSIVSIASFINGLSVSGEVFSRFLDLDLNEWIRNAALMIATSLNGVFEVWREAIYPIFQALEAWLGIQLPDYAKEALSAAILIASRYIGAILINRSRARQLARLAPRNEQIKERYGDDIERRQQELKLVRTREKIPHFALDPYATSSALTMIVLVGGTLVANLMYLAGQTYLSLALYALAFAITLPLYLRTKKIAERFDSA